jgi:hypothetical protein
MKSGTGGGIEGGEHMQNIIFHLKLYSCICKITCTYPEIHRYIARINVSIKEPADEPEHDLIWD